MKSIRKKITVSLMATVLVALIAVGSSSITMNYKSTLATVEQMMSETVVLASERIEQELIAYKNVTMDTGCIPQLSDESVPLEDKRAIIDERVSMHGFQRGNIISIDGHSIFDGNDYSDREYVKTGHAGKRLCIRAADQQDYRRIVYYGGGASLCRWKPECWDRGCGLFWAAGVFF